MLNGAPPSCNVYWQVGSSATLGTNSTFIGTIMALTSISLKTGAKLDGRALARNGAVTLDTNTITRSACPTSTSTSPSPSPSTSTSTKTGASQITAVPRGPVGTGDNSIG
jgi:Ice-binding-like